MVVLRFTTLSVLDCHWRNPRRKNHRERSNIKSACVSALTGSVQSKMAYVWQTFQHSPLIEKLFVVFRHLQPIFLHTGLLFLDFPSWISRSARNKRILERKPLIDTSYCILHRLELNIFTSHNFCSMLIEQLINLEKWELRSSYG